jgi:hypothetical protein
MQKLIENFLVKHSNNGGSGAGNGNRKISSIKDYNADSNSNRNLSQQQLMINEELFQKMLTICIDHFKSQQKISINDDQSLSNENSGPKQIDPNDIDQFIQSYYSTSNFNTFLNSARSRSHNHFIFKVLFYFFHFLFSYLSQT